MSQPNQSSISQLVARRLLWLLVALYLIPGLMGHDPWKPEDAAHFGVIQSALSTPSLIPTLFGSSQTDFGPLFYWTNSALTSVLHAMPGLPVDLDDASRLSSALFGLGYFIFMFLAARRWFGHESGPAAVLLAIGCLGLIAPVHETQPQALVLMLLAAEMWALSAVGDSHWQGWLILSIVLIALVLTCPPIIAFACLLLAWSTLLSQGREQDGASTKICLRNLSIATLIAGIAVAAWLSWLDHNESAAYTHWQQQWLPGFSTATEFSGRLLRVSNALLWFAWPALPIACWSVWKFRRHLREPAFAMCLSACLLILLSLVWNRPLRPVTLLPLLPPLVLLATPGLLNLRRGAANAFTWFGAMSFSLFIALIWLGWLAMLSGWPPKIARNFARLEPGFVLQFQPLAVAAGLLLTAAWCWLIMRQPKSNYRGAITWAAGMTALWGLVMALWLPWIDYGKTYRNVSHELKAHLPAQYDCLMQQGLPAAQMSSLYYFDHLKFKPASANCHLLLVYSSSKDEEVHPGSQWVRRWEGRRPGDRQERLRLYQRD